MAPNQRSLLLYENDDLEKVATFEKKGEYLRNRTTALRLINHPSSTKHRSILLARSDLTFYVCIHFHSFIHSLGYRTTPILYINGERVSEELAKKARSNQTLLSFLRDAMRLTGSKLGCAEGGCGACTVM
jgi:hypothetical protein